MGGLPMPHSRMTPDTPAPILALVRDLIFSTKIATTAKASGVTVKIIRDPEKLAGIGGRMLLVDLNLPGAIEAAAAWRKAQVAEIIGFVSHVDAATAAMARSAGIERVLARSRFVEVLHELLVHGTIV